VGRSSGAPETKIRLFSAARRQLAGSVVVSWVRAVLGAAAAVVIAAAIDGVVAGRDATGSVVALGILLGLRGLAAAAAPLLAASTATTVEADLRRRVLDAVLTVGPPSLRRTGEVIGPATEGIDAAGGLAGTFLPQLIAGMSIPILVGIIVAIIDPVTAVVLILLLPVTPVLLRFLERRFSSVSARYRVTADQLAARFLDGVQGLRTLKAFDRATDYGDEIAAEAERLRVETMSLLRVNQLALLAVDSLFTLGTVVAASAMAATRAAAGAISVGEAVAIVLLGMMLIEPLTLIGRFFYVGAIGRAAAGQIRELLRLASGFTVPPTASGATPGAIEFAGVGFSYEEGRPAATDVTFQVEPGERVALVGPSGAGKTTVAHLALGLLRPSRGTIRIGGRAVLVPQRPFLFHGSVADNLRLARPDATEHEMWAALEAAELAHVVARRPGGLEVAVGERGLQISGGEAQRLAIARALLVDAPIVILDEPTSNVDLDTEARLHNAMGILMEHRTVVIIAHRRSTIVGVDRILLMEEGTIAASGAPASSDGAEILSRMGVTPA